MSFLNRFVRVGSEQAEWLLFTGLYHILFGLTNVLVPEGVGRHHVFAWLPGEFNSNELGWLWIVTGVYISLSIILRKEPPRYLKGPIFAAIIAPTVWGFIFFVSAVVYGDSASYSGAVTYLFISMATILISGYPDRVFYNSKRTKKKG